MRRVRTTVTLLLVAVAALAPAAARADSVATTGAATGVTATTATLHGTVKPVTADSGYVFQYGTTTAYGKFSSSGTAAAAGPVSAIVTGLSPNTTYHFRLVVEDAGSDPAVFHSGADGTFTTTAGGGAVAVTGGATSLTPTSATLHGMSNLPVAGEWAFQYGTSLSFGKQTPATKVDAGPHTLAALLTGLQPATTYHYRLLVVQATATFPYYAFTAGAERTFRTPATAPARRFGTARLLSTVLAVRSGRAAVRLRCNGPAGARCGGSVSLAAPNARGRLVGCGAAGFSASGGQARTVGVRLSAGCAARLAGAPGHRLAAKLTIRFSTHQGTLRRSVTLSG